MSAVAYRFAVRVRASSKNRRNANCFEISYADVVERGPRLHELFAFLGATYDAARIDTVLAMPHSYQPQTP